MSVSTAIISSRKLCALFIFTITAFWAAYSIGYRQIRAFTFNNQAVFQMGFTEASHGGIQSIVLRLDWFLSTVLGIVLYVAPDQIGDYVFVSYILIFNC